MQACTIDRILFTQFLDILVAKVKDNIWALFICILRLDIDSGGLKRIESDADVHALYDLDEKHVKVDIKNHAGNMSVVGLIAWAEEEAKYSYLRSPPVKSRPFRNDMKDGMSASKNDASKYVKYIESITNGRNEGRNDGMNEGMNEVDDIAISKKRKVVSRGNNISIRENDGHNVVLTDSEFDCSDHAYKNSESDSDQSDKSFNYPSDGENEVIELWKRMRQSKVTSTEVPDEVPIDEGTSAQGQDTTVDVDKFGEVDDTCLGEKFLTVDKFKECLTYYALANGFSLYFERINKENIVAKCGQRKEVIKDPSQGKQRAFKKYPFNNPQNTSYRWRCYCKLMQNEVSYQVVSLIDDHCCVRNFNYGRLISSKWLGRHFGDKIRMNPQITLDKIARLVKNKYKCIVSKNQCRNAKKFDLNEGEVTIQDHYDFLRSYAKALADSNEGSTIKVGVTVNPDEKTYFYRFYVCFKALKDGWKIAEDLEVPNGAGLTLISDQHKDVANFRYMRTYSHYMKPVDGINFFPDCSHLSRILGPKPRKMPRRPGKKRFRASHVTKSNTRISRVGVIIRCHNYWEIRHNKKGCKKEPIPSVPKEKRKKKKFGSSSTCLVKIRGGKTKGGRLFPVQRLGRMGSLLGINGATSDTIKETKPYQASMPVIKNPLNLPRTQQSQVSGVGGLENCSLPLRKQTRYLGALQRTRTATVMGGVQTTTTTSVRGGTTTTGETKTRGTSFISPRLKSQIILNKKVSEQDKGTRSSNDNNNVQK
uniref:Transposase, MuDR, MULE transposase domain protein n=1 Tax=Tanacetum cinerariifolium TaxID=118510 RepID=A0A699GYI1_TANCI|nr:hypothetical protein [Tanacetum cinerariifolium]